MAISGPGPTGGSEPQGQAAPLHAIKEEIIDPKIKAEPGRDVPARRIVRHVRLDRSGDESVQDVGREGIAAEDAEEPELPARAVARGEEGRVDGQRDAGREGLVRDA